MRIVLDLQGVVIGFAAGVLDRGGAQVRKLLVTGDIEVLIGVVVAHQVRAVGADIGDADGLIVAELPLHLQVPFGDHRNDILREQADCANARRVVQVQAGEISARQCGGGIGGN